jgi:hypothetical protein
MNDETRDWVHAGSAARFKRLESANVGHPWLLRLYPSAWRARYGEEFAELLTACPLTLGTVVDVICGALDAHLHGDVLLGRARMINRLRASEIAVFCAYIAFVVAGIGYQKMTEYDDFLNLAHAHLEVGAPYYTIVYTSAIALLAVLVGGLPLAFVAAQQALAARRWGILALFAVPVVSFIALIATIEGALRLVAPHPTNTPPTPGDAASFHILAIVFGVGAIASTFAVSAAIARSDLPANLIRFAFWPGVVAAAAMAVMLVATIIWGFALHADAPALYNGNDGALGSSTAASYLAIVGLMAIATIAAVAACAFGQRARTARVAAVEA